jgi:uncharacterized membrane protein YeaQ/YmgE (transglycosylase-associated protein family)
LEYVWFAVIGLAIGLVAGYFLQGNNFGIRGDVAFGVIGALVFGVGLGASGAAPESGAGAGAAMAAVGAALALVLRRVLKSV